MNSSNSLVIRGWRTDNIDQEIATAISLISCAIFLSYGMNDPEYCRESAQWFIRQYKKQTHKLKEALPSTKTFIDSPIPTDVAAIAQVPVYVRYKEFGEASKQICGEEQTIYVNNTTLTGWSPAAYEVDGMHPRYPYYPIWLAHMASEAGI